MLRWVALSGLLCIAFVSLGLGQILPITSGMQNLFLAMAALSGTVLISSYDAYETQGPDHDDS